MCFNSKKVLGQSQIYEKNIVINIFFAENCPYIRLFATKMAIIMFFDGKILPDFEINLKLQPRFFDFICIFADSNKNMM